MRALALAFALGSAIVPDIASAQSAPAAERAPPKIPIRLHGIDIGYVRAAGGSTTAEARAASIEGRLREVLSATTPDARAVRIAPREHETDVLIGDRLVLSVNEADAAPDGRTHQQLAADFSERLRAALTDAAETRSVRNLLRAGLKALVATAALIVLFVGLVRGFARLRSFISVKGATKELGLRIQGLELMSASQVTELFLSITGLARVATILFVFAVYVNLILGFFPWTRGVAEELADALLSAVSWLVFGILGYLPNLLYIAIIVVVTSYALRVAKMVFRAVDRGAVTLPGFHREWADPTYKILRFLVLALAVVIVFPYLPGSSSPAFQSVSIFLGVLFSLGSTSATANVIAGIVLTYMRPFNVGDRIKVGDTSGDVIEKNLLVVRLRTSKNVEITLPNSMVLNHHIINYSAEKRSLLLHTTVTIGYDAPWRRVHELLIAAARSTDGLLSEPAPFVLQTALNDFYVAYEINATTDRPNEMEHIYGRLHQNIQDRFNEAGLEIMSPHYVAARDGNTTTVPEMNRPGGYEPGAFRVKRTGGD